MKPWKGWLVAFLIVVPAAACDWDEERVSALERWAHLMAPDRDDATSPGSPEDPAWAWLMENGFCQAVAYSEELFREATGAEPTAQRPPLVRRLCGPPDPDPVSPPPFPPDE
jgi:hypothetical protein